MALGYELGINGHRNDDDCALLLDGQLERELSVRRAIRSIWLEIKLVHSFSSSQHYHIYGAREKIIEKL